MNLRSPWLQAIAPARLIRNRGRRINARTMAALAGNNRAAVDRKAGTPTTPIIPTTPTTPVRNSTNALANAVVVEVVEVVVGVVEETPVVVMPVVARNKHRSNRSRIMRAVQPARRHCYWRPYPWL